ncbi:hypothetical protein IWW50_000717 [Coemansia erecta]|nr:hypothetical protein IWW50_000717 [Coemansia erecta]
MRKVFCVLTQGRLIEFKYPIAPLAPGQTMLAEHMLQTDPTMSHVFKDIGNSSSWSAGSPGASAAGAKPAYDSNASLLFSKLRSLSLRRCYVVSRFTDDLSTNDIMCEPWVMTDIGNYTGLRLADRVYADGIISHELITDCIFTVWRPTFVPQILRAGNAPEMKHIPEECLSDVSEQSADSRCSSSNGQNHGQAAPIVSSSNSPSQSPSQSLSQSPSPNQNQNQGQNQSQGQNQNQSQNRGRAVSFSPPLRVPTAPERPDVVSQHQHSSSHDYQRHSSDTRHRASAETPRTSSEAPRISGDGYMSSMSNASSISSSRPHDAKPGAYRVGNEIHLNVDDKRDGSKRMGAIGMTSSMRRRVGVYKARTNSEMSQWVTAINQEIRRMSLSGEW